MVAPLSRQPNRPNKPPLFRFVRLAVEGTKIPKVPSHANRISDFPLPRKPTTLSGSFVNRRGSGRAFNETKKVEKTRSRRRPPQLGPLTNEHRVGSDFFLLFFFSFGA